MALVHSLSCDSLHPSNSGTGPVLLASCYIISNMSKLTHPQLSPGTALPLFNYSAKAIPKAASTTATQRQYGIAYNSKLWLNELSPPK